MVVKTDVCAFSEYRIYPGHGIKYIRRDGQPVLLSTAKCRRLAILEKKKSSKLMWTQAWRRLNKKGKDEGLTRKRARKVVKVQRGIAGVSIEDIAKKIQAKKPKNVATEAALKEVKERAKAAKKSSAVARPGAGAGGQAPKVQVKHTAKVVSGGKR